MLVVCSLEIIIDVCIFVSFRKYFSMRKAWEMATRTPTGLRANTGFIRVVKYSVLVHTAATMFGELFTIVSYFFRKLQVYSIGVVTYHVITSLCLLYWSLPLFSRLVYILAHTIPREVSSLVNAAL